MKVILKLSLLTEKLVQIQDELLDCEWVILNVQEEKEGVVV